MKYLKLFLKERKGKVGITLIMLLGQAVGTLLIPFLIAGIVDNGILKGDMNEILNIGDQICKLRSSLLLQVLNVKI